MPIQKIEVLEYECARCGYKWINRVNGHDGPVPQKCARCKRSGWNGGEKDLITPREMGLRRRIKYFEILYDNVSSYSFWSTEMDWPKGLCEKFLKAQNRIELMLRIMKSRVINDYDPAAVIIQQRKEREEAKNQTIKSHKQLLEEIKKRQGHQIDIK
jgi:hypothetical protein